jgi:hypothetical protein
MLSATRLTAARLPGWRPAQQILLLRIVAHKAAVMTSSHTSHTAGGCRFGLSVSKQIKIVAKHTRPNTRRSSRHEDGATGKVNIPVQCPFKKLAAWYSNSCLQQQQTIKISRFDTNHQMGSLMIAQETIEEAE